MVAVDHCHENKIMHRDIKPSNILIHEKKIILSDFGQARVDLGSIDQDELNSFHDVQNPILTLEVGSRWYKSPELLFGDRQYRQSIDIWSASCIFYELVFKALINSLS